MYIPAVLQKLIALGHLNLDLNAFCAVSTGSSRNADALVRLLDEASPKPNLAMLFDGDDGGKARQRAAGPLLKTKGVQSRQLLDGTTIEDYLPLVGELYVRAVADYVAKVMETHDRAPDDMDRHRSAFRSSFRESFEEGKVTRDVAGWAAGAGEKLGGLDQPPSKVGIAREYIRLLEEAEPERFTPQSLQRSLKLAEWIKELLPVPEVQEARKDILSSTTA